MSSPIPSKPQRTFLFRVIAFFTHLQVGYLVRSMRNPRLFLVLFAVFAGALALAIITAVAYITELPLVFPPLGASAFILFFIPMSEQASPRSVVLAHTLGLLLGLLSLRILVPIFPNSEIMDPSVVNWARITAVALAMGFCSASMIAFRCVHPPAAATSLIAAMGYFVNMLQILGFVAAVILLVSEAIVLIRLLGGIPYPLWQYDREISKHYRELAGLSGGRSGSWGQLSARFFQHR